MQFYGLVFFRKALAGSKFISKGKAEMDRRILEAFEDCPVVAAIKDEEGLKKCLGSDIPIVFVLYGDICNIRDIVGRLKQAGKIVIIHLDLITGLSSKEIAVTYLRSVTHGDGIISTKPAVIRNHFYKTCGHTKSERRRYVCHYAVFCDRLYRF